MFSTSSNGLGKFGSVPLKDHNVRYIPSLSH